MFMVKEDMDCMTEAYERIQEEYSTTQREQENTQVGLLNILSEVKVTMKGQSQMLPCPQLLLPQYSRYMYLTEVIQSHFLFVFLFQNILLTNINTHKGIRQQVGALYFLEGHYSRSR